MPESVRRDDGPLVRVRNLRITFRMRRAAVRAVDDVSFDIGRGEIVGLVGESGSGKSTLGAALLRMVPAPGEIINGSIVLDGQDLLSLSAAEMRQLRGRDVSLIVQDALAAMNPVTTVGEQVGEVIRDHVGGSRREVAQRVLEILRQVRLPRPELNVRRHAHELSGGMQQRVVIAGALVLHPKLIVADEPTTALDVTVQAQILRLLADIRGRTGTSILFITHDLATVAQVCDRVMVMYAGRIVEAGPVAAIFADPLHPYTRSLLASLPPLQGEPPDELAALPGQPPRPEEWPSGCRFHPRCPLREALGRPRRCVDEEPLPDTAHPHWGACHFLDRRHEMDAPQSGVTTPA
jgi:oligopeptide/dipeptide ABC transporter ATP-binding protein